MTKRYSSKLRWISPALLVLGLLFTSIQLGAQQFANLDVRITQVSHNFQCCTDATGISCGFLPNRPEPRWRVRVRPNTGTFGGITTVNPGSPSCGTIGRNDLVQSYSNLCDPVILIEVESWEDDACGSDNTFNTGCVNDDENQVTTTFTINYQNDPANTNNSYSFSQTNSYGIVIQVNWSVAGVVPTPTTNATAISICPGNTANFNVTSGLSNPANQFEWYTNAALTNSTGVTGTGFTTPSLSSTTSYWVAEVSPSGCKGPARQVTVNMHPLPTPTITGNLSICSGQSTTLTANGGVSYVWNSGANTPTLSVNPTISTSYSVTATSANGCTASTSILVTVNPTPSAPAGLGTTICAGQTATINASSTSGLGGTLQWYDQFTGGTLLGSGTSFTTVALNSNTTFFVQELTAAGCPSPRTAVLVTVNPAPAPPTANGVSICAGQTATLTAIGSGGSIDWYAAATGGAPLQSGATYTTNPLSVSTTFYAQQTQAGCPSTRQPVLVTVNAIPAIPTVADQTICQGQSATMTAGNSGGTIRWYSSAGLSPASLVFTGATFTTPPLSVNTSYWVNETSVQGCTSAADQVNIVVNPSPAAPTASGTTICAGTTATLTATGAGTVNWYDAPNGSVLGSGTSFTTAILNQNTIFYAAVVDANNCTSAYTPVQVTVNQLPLAPQASAATVCQGQNTIIQANGTGTFTFYNSALTILGSNATGVFDAGILSPGQYTFYVSINNGICESNRTTLTATVTANPAAPTASGVTICTGATATLSATGSNTLQWFSDATLTNLLASGSTYTTPVLTNNTTYYVASNTNGCQGLATAVSVTVNAAAAAPTASGTSICAGQTATLTATGLGTLEWYDAIVGGNLLATGASFTTPNLNNATTYYVQDVISGCTSNRVAVTVNINPIPNAPISSGQVVCAGQTATLIAQGSGTLDWFDAPTAGNLLFSGASFTTPALNANTTYYVQATVNGCSSNRTAVTVGVNPVPAAPTTTDVTICYGTQTTLLANGTGLVNWYADAALSVQLGVGAVFTTPVLTSSTTYYATQSDNGCEGAATAVMVTVEPQSTISVSGTSPICAGSTSTLVVNATGNTGYTYAWSNGAGTNDTAIVSPAITTTYFVEVITPAGCKLNGSFTVNVDPSPSVQVIGNAAICAGASTTLTAIGGGATGLNYAWSNGINTAIQTVSPATTTSYTVTVSTAAGCTASDVLQVVVTPQVSVNITGNASACSGQTTSLTANATGGTTFTYSWNQSAGNTASVNVSPTSSTTYSVTVTNEGGCTATDVFSLDITTLSGVTISGDNNLCEGELTTLFAQGNGAISWYDAAAGGTLLGTGASFETNSLSSSTTFYAEQTLNGCTSVRTAYLVTVIAAPSLSSNPSSNSPLCEGDNLSIDAPSLSGVSYAWDGPNGFTANTEDISINSVTENDHQGFFNLTLTDNITGCSSEPYVVLVMVNALPPSIYLPPSFNVCKNGSVTLTAPTVFQGSYAWTGPNGFSSTDQSPLIDPATSTTAGTYTLILSVGNCSAAPVSTVLNVDPLPVVIAGADVSLEEGTSVTLEASGALYYEWSPANNLSSSTSDRPVYTATLQGVYTYTVTGYNQYGCSSSDDVVITVLPASSIQAPDLITPNGDGINDNWEVSYLQNFGGYVLQIYDRQGQVLFESNNYTNNWNATYEGKQLPEGTYWYIIRTDAGRQFKGAISVKR